MVIVLILNYAVGVALRHKGAKGGLILFNPLTKREVIRRTYKNIGPTVPSTTRPEYELDETGIMTETTVSQDTTTADVNEFKYLIGTIHRDYEDLELYKTVEVREETFGDDEGPVIVAYRRRLKPNGKFEPKCEDDEYPIHIQDIVQTTDDYSKLHPEKTAKKVTAKLANRLLAFGFLVKQESKQRPACKPLIDWNKRLPRTFTEVLSISMTHPDRAGSITPTVAEIKSIRDMGTYDPDEVLAEAQMKISKIGMSKIVFT